MCVYEKCANNWYRIHSILEFCISICFSQLHRIDMSLDTKLILDAISKLFDKFDAWWAKRDTAWEPSRRVPILT
jgi:hypothetical protein